MAMPKHTNLFISTTAALLLGACTQGTGLYANTMSMDTQAKPAGQQAAGEPASPAQSFNRFPDIPIPTGANMDMTRTIVFGGGEGWYGQLGLDTGHGPNAMFDFYKQELPTFAWNEITSVRAPVSVLTYERQSRIISIQLETGTISGTKVTLTISPRAGASTVGSQTLPRNMPRPMMNTAPPLN